jgi:hypothetical protein
MCPPYVRYLLMILLEHLLVGLLLVVSAAVSGPPDYIQKKIAISQVDMS